MTPSRRGITLLEVIVIVIVVVVLIGILLPARSHRRPAPRLHEANNLRALHIAFAALAPDLNGYPIPSRLDRNNTTVNLTDPGEKNTSGAMISYLIFQAIISPETAISPLEQADVHVMEDLEFKAPSTAVNPDLALWDPRFKGTPKDIVPGPKTTAGHFSYAHAPFATLRDGAPAAASTAAAIPILSGRGPLYEPDPKAAGTFRPSRADKPHGAGSVTLDMYGDGGDWRGNVAFTDGSVQFMSPTLANGDHIFIRTTPTPATPSDAYLRQYWRGIPMNTSPDPTFNPYAEPNGPHVYIDGDR